MSIQTKVFVLPDSKEATEINDWLKNNPNITIISTNTFANGYGWGYIIMYST